MMNKLIEELTEKPGMTMS